MRAICAELLALIDFFLGFGNGLLSCSYYLVHAIILYHVPPLIVV